MIAMSPHIRSAVYPPPPGSPEVPVPTDPQPPAPSPAPEVPSPTPPQPEIPAPPPERPPKRPPDEWPATE